jgi:acetyl-CoA carboxylase alpha subunit
MSVKETLEFSKAATASTFTASMALKDTATGSVKSTVTAVYYGMDNPKFMDYINKLFDDTVAKAGPTVGIDRKAVVKAQRTFDHGFFQHLMDISEKNA